MEALRAEIERHNHLYYVTTQPTLSDAEYDALYRKLQDLEAQYPEFITPSSPTQRVGSQPSASFASIEHSIPMLSFANAFTSTQTTSPMLPNQNWTVSLLSSFTEMGSWSMAPRGAMDAWARTSQPISAPFAASP